MYRKKIGDIRTFTLKTYYALSYCSCKDTEIVKESNFRLILLNLYSCCKDAALYMKLRIQDVRVVYRVYYNAIEVVWTQE